MNKINIYGHYGSNNHGNEAIVRGAKKIFSDYDVNLFSYNVESDIFFGLDKIVNVLPIKFQLERYSFKNIFGKIIFKIRKNDSYRDIFRYKAFFKSINQNDIFLFEAGDQLFETMDLIEHYDWINRQIKKRGGILVFFLGSIPEKRIKELEFFLDKFDFIMIRESISYNAIKNIEKYKKKIMFSPCCAFLMEKEKVNLPEIFKKPVIGLTFGYLAQSKESYNNCLITNIHNLLVYLIEQTNYNIALIPHVNVARELSDLFLFEDLIKNNNYPKDRISIIGENSANVQKYIISKCNLYLTVRTHVSIAAFSSFVPTVVLSYSQKSKGISLDLFDATKDYTLEIDTLMTNDFALIDSYKWLENNQTMIKNDLKSNMVGYLEPLKQVRKVIQQIMDKKR